MTVLFALPYILGSFPIDLSPTGIAAASASGSPTVIPGAADVSPSALASGEAFGDATVALPNGAQDVLPAGLTTSGAVGSPAVTPGEVRIAPVGCPSVEMFGNPDIVPGPVVITPSGIGSGAALGAPVAIRGFKISPTGIAAFQGFLTFGTPTVGAASTPVLHPASIATGEGFGRPALGGGVGATILRRTYVIPAEVRTSVVPPRN